MTRAIVPKELDAFSILSWGLCSDQVYSSVGGKNCWSASRSLRPSWHLQSFGACPRAMQRELTYPGLRSDFFTPWRGLPSAQRQGLRMGLKSHFQAQIILHQTSYLKFKLVSCLICWIRICQFSFLISNYGGSGSCEDCIHILPLRANLWICLPMAV